MKDDSTLKFAVDGFCSSRTVCIYKILFNSRFYGVLHHHALFFLPSQILKSYVDLVSTVTIKKIWIFFFFKMYSFFK